MVVGLLPPACLVGDRKSCRSSEKGELGTLGRQLPPKIRVYGGAHYCSAQSQARILRSSTYHRALWSDSHFLVQLQTEASDWVQRMGKAYSDQWTMESQSPEILIPGISLGTKEWTKHPRRKTGQEIQV